MEYVRQLLLSVVRWTGGHLERKHHAKGYQRQTGIGDTASRNRYGVLLNPLHSCVLPPSDCYFTCESISLSQHMGRRMTATSNALSVHIRTSGLIDTDICTWRIRGDLERFVCDHD
jgi:hypothetical protein